ncbi:hypothetical protein O181_028039 [Austropuccinia psidii MF-1]|uniref:CCHC-type domain-containing protein n=1 Tax=Austropuccinia psidii MF-1 TaxID=1389203 RepID=A0A9Q3CN43_9BASI|nr:hypothetical protein [Austropuccinia psidii MF-1]
MKEIHGRRNWQWWKSQIIQKYSNGTWIWQNTMSFESDKYSVDKYSYEWCLRQSKLLKGIDPQMNIHMSNHKLLTQGPGELGQAVKFRCNQHYTLDDSENTLQDFQRETTLRVDFKDKPSKRVEEAAKKKNSCHNCGSTYHYASNCPKAKKKVYAIEEVPQEESPTEDSDSESMGDAIREQSDDDQDPREEFLVEYLEETP